MYNKLKKFLLKSGKFHPSITYIGVRDENNDSKNFY